MTGRDTEASAWLVRLGRPVIGQDDLLAFRAWRDDAANDEAFRSQQDVWRRAGRLPPDPELGEALAAARGRRRSRAAMVGRGAWACGGVAVILLGVVALARRPEAYATTVGERSQIRLADGSSVVLDADSRITVALGRTARTVQLTRGQALFEVAHDVRRPFTVTAGDLKVTALGTRFDVRRDSGRDAHVTLLQGRVQVRAARSPGPTELALAPGQETSTARPTVRAAQGDDAVAWTSGRLVFHAQTLSDVVAEANRYSRRRLTLEPDPHLDSVRVTGSFVAGDTPSIAQALADLYDLKVEGRPDGELVLRRG